MQTWPLYYSWRDGRGLWLANFKVGAWWELMNTYCANQKTDWKMVWRNIRCCKKQQWNHYKCYWMQCGLFLHLTLLYLCHYWFIYITYIILLVSWHLDITMLMVLYTHDSSHKNVVWDSIFCCHFFTIEERQKKKIIIIK